MYFDEKYLCNKWYEMLVRATGNYPIKEFY